MITRCPECSTLFKVVSDQLKISDGWVRCGQCGHVFDGTANLQDETLQAPEVAPAPQEDAPAVHDHAITPEFIDKPQTLGSPTGGVEPPLEAQEWGADEATALIGPEPEEDAAGLQWKADAEQDARGSAVSFLHASEPRTSVWTRPWLRWLLALISVVLLLALALQMALHERDRIAANWLDARPWLQTLCQGLGCSIEPLKGIESITVDSSSFNRVRSDVYRLQVTIKNTASTELALPAVELTLTDTRDAAMLRRVLLPVDFQPAARSIAAGSEWSGVLTVSVAGSASPARIAGYKVLAFYY